MPKRGALQARCDCGATATHWERVSIVTGSGIPHYDWLSLCDRCYAEHQQTERMVADAWPNRPAPEPGHAANAKLSVADIKEMRRLYADGEATTGQLAERYGVNRRHAWMVVTRRVWSSVN